MFEIPKPEQLPPLSPEDEKKPYASFYYRGPVTPSEDTLSAIQFGFPMDPEFALKPDNVDCMLEDGYMQRESGYCILPNGIGYGAALTKMPNVTVEMNDWWGPWHEHDDLRYKLWFPGSHQRVGLKWVQEDVGVGLEDIYFVQKLNVEIIGYSLDRVQANKDLVLVRGQNGLAKATPSTPEVRPKACVVMHYIRRMPSGGIEYRTRFWIGIHFYGGKPVRMIPDGVKIEEEVAYGFALHGAYEMATLGSILPELYALFGEVFPKIH